MRKRVFWHMRTAKAQISLHIRAVWSGPSLSANRIIGHYRMRQWKANVRMRLCACVGWICICAFCARWKTHFGLARPTQSFRRIQLTQSYRRNQLTTANERKSTCETLTAKDTHDRLGPVVQSVVSLTSSLRVILLTVLVDSIHNILIFFAEKMWVAFALQKLLTFFQQKISAYLRITRCKF